MDPDPDLVGPKTYGYDVSGSATLLENISHAFVPWRTSILFKEHGWSHAKPIIIPTSPQLCPRLCVVATACSRGEPIEFSAPLNTVQVKKNSEIEAGQHGLMNYKDTKPYMPAFLSVDLLTDFAAFCLTDFIDWRYCTFTHGMYEVCSITNANGPIKQKL